MCLAIPVQVKEIKNNNRAVVDNNGVNFEVSTNLVENLKVGDFVLIHAGFILEILTHDDAREKLALLEEFYQKTGRGKNGKE
ncbi:MAG: HypC/HybG/HupF family hydrogenase formation chaperone [Myxococcota bacterium]